MKSRLQLVLLDRDGLLLEEGDRSITTAQEVRFIEGACAAVKRLQDAGLALAVVTNQSVVGRGELSEGSLARIHEAVTAGLAEHGVTLKHFHVCLHARDAGCRCRKPAPGLVEDAASAQGVAVEACIMLGNRRTDIQAAVRAGCEGILVHTGKLDNLADLKQWPSAPLGVAQNLNEAVDWVLSGAPDEAFCTSREWP